MNKKTIFVAALFVASAGLSALPGADAGITSRAFINVAGEADFGTGIGIYDLAADDYCLALLSTGQIGTGTLISYYYTTGRMSSNIGLEGELPTFLAPTNLNGIPLLEDCLDDILTELNNTLNTLFGDPTSPPMGDDDMHAQTQNTGILAGFEFDFSMIMEDSSAWAPDTGSIHWNTTYCLPIDAQITAHGMIPPNGATAACDASLGTSSDYGSASLDSCQSGWSYGGTLNPTISRNDDPVWAFDRPLATIPGPLSCDHKGHDHLDKQPSADLYYAMFCGTIDLFDLSGGGADRTVSDDTWALQMTANSDPLELLAELSNTARWDGLFGADERASWSPAEPDCDW